MSQLKDHARDRGSMRRIVAHSAATRKSRPPRSAYGRAVEEIARTLGIDPDTVRDQLNVGHSYYERVALFNRVLLSHGCLDEFAVRMAIIERSSDAFQPLPLLDALHDAELADTAEQLDDETFRFRLQQGTAEIADAERFCRSSALARWKALRAEREARAWIDRMRTGHEIP